MSYLKLENKIELASTLYMKCSECNLQAVKEILSKILNLYEIGALITHPIDYLNNNSFLINFFTDNENESLQIITVLLNLFKNDDPISKVTFSGLLNHSNNNKQTPLHISCQCGHLNILKFLLQNGATTINDTDNYNYSPLAWACNNGNNQMIDILFEAGAKLTIHSLIACIDTDRIDLLLHLLDERTEFDINYNEKGVNLLHVAFSKKKIDLVIELVKKGCNIYLKNNKNQTILDLIEDENVYSFNNDKIVGQQLRDLIINI